MLNEHVDFLLFFKTFFWGLFGVVKIEPYGDKSRSWRPEVDGVASRSADTSMQEAEVRSACTVSCNIVCHALNLC